MHSLCGWQWCLGLMFLLIAVSNRINAQELCPGVSIEKSGNLRVGEVSVALSHFGEKWTRFTLQSEATVAAEKGYPQAKTDGGWELRGAFAGFQLIETLKPANGGVELDATLSSNSAVQTDDVSLSISLPLEEFAQVELQFDAKRVTLPAEFGEKTVFSANGIKRITIPAPSGRVVIEGDFAVQLQDDRAFQQNVCVLRLRFTPNTGGLTRAALNARLRLERYNTVALDLSRQANMAFRDEVAEDGKGGWTDQGPSNDLRMLPVGNQTFGSVNFTILDAARNQGNSCVVFAGPERPGMLKQAEVSGDNRPHSNLYLLHALAWRPAGETMIGTLRIVYADGTQSRQEVRAGREVGDWWAPSAVTNGSLAWTGENADAYVGLFLSRFALENKPLAKVVLESAGRAVWMVAGLSVGDAVPVRRGQPYYVLAGKDWKPIDHKIDVDAGSALDFSFLQDAPAGKYGAVVARDGHFEFSGQPGTPVRFYGANLCFSALYMEKPDVERMVRQMVRMGYNTVRIHHYDRELIAKGSADGTDLDDVRLDQLDYLLAKCKENGLYISTDIFTIRNVRRSLFADVPAGGEFLTMKEFKALAVVHPGVYANWLKFAVKILTHVNPYTGLAWKDDPALFNICLINEGNLNHVWNHAANQYNAAFEQWCKERGFTATTSQMREPLFNRFLNETESSFYAKGSADLRKLGLKALLTNLNMQSLVPLALPREEFDYVDNHGYWDHPRFGGKEWGLPFLYQNRSAVCGGASVPGALFPSRVLGKPFAVTEFNYCFPNPYRAEGGPLMGAYAAFQDWDLLHRFTYSHGKQNLHEVAPTGTFDIITDPISLFSDRIGVLLFRRGDVKPATTCVPFAYSDRCLDGRASMPNAPWEAGRIGLMVKTGALNLGDGKTLPADYPAALGMENFPADRLAEKPYLNIAAQVNEGLAKPGMLKPGLYDDAAKRYSSETGELELATEAGTFRVMTPRSEVLILPEKKSLAGKVLKAENVGAYCVVAAHAIDDLPLAQSRRILLFHLSNSTNSKMKYRDATRMTVEKWGDAPHLVQSSTVEVRLRLAGKAYQVWALDMSGKRSHTMPLTSEGGEWRFSAATLQQSGCFLAYEMVAVNP